VMFQQGSILHSNQRWPRSTQPGHPFMGNKIMSRPTKTTNESWRINRHTAQCTSLVSVVSQCKLVSCLATLALEVTKIVSKLVSNFYSSNSGPIGPSVRFSCMTLLNSGNLRTLGKGDWTRLKCTHCTIQYQCRSVGLFICLWRTL